MVRLSIIIVAALMLATACGESDADGDTNADAEVQALASLEIFADMVRNVGGDRVEVDALLPSGADPHTFELPPARVADIVDADIVFINGLALEETFGDVIQNNATGSVVKMTEGLPILEADGQADEEHADDEGAHAEGNPHLWLDVRLAGRYVERIRDELIAIDPEGADVYENNATVYLDELGELDREIEEAVDSIPEANRTLVTFHDAFPYFASRYGLDIVVAVTSPGQEPSPQAVALLVDEIRGVPAAFKEPQFNPEVLERAAEDADVRLLDLLSDAFIDGVDSYVEMMRFNVDQLLEGLGGR